MREGRRKWVAALTWAAALAAGDLPFWAPGAFSGQPFLADAQSGVSSYTYGALGTGWSNVNGAYSFSSSAEQR